MIYLDTSVVVAYYCPETLSSRAEKLVRLEPAPAISNLTRVEFASALARKTQADELSSTQAGRIATEFEKHIREGLYSQVPLDHRHFDQAREWLATLRTGLRTLDALHLAVATEAGMRIATADRSLARAARKLGIEVVDIFPRD